MATLNLLIAVSLVYIVFLFGVAFWAERAARIGRLRWLRSPLIYTLSLSIYCTGWTFYGAVGYAARAGLEYVTIYLGPTLVMLGWWWVLRKLVRIGRAQRATSIADLISSRYGKSNLLAGILTAIAVIGVAPYIALQLQSVTQSLLAFAPVAADGARAPIDLTRAGFWLALGLALFTILFGTRSLNANERHDGVVVAIAVEAVVKLIALLAVGAFVVWGIAGGVGETLARIDASTLGQWQMDGGRWATLTFLAAVAFLCLPRMFQVMVVENQDERHLQVAAWAFPIYLLLISLFVVPIAVVGLSMMPQGSNPDLFVLTIPLAQGQDTLALFVFLGGFSSATSMVIVATLALATMVSNHVVMPVWLRQRGQGASMSGDVRNVAILARRFSIIVILGVGYAYFAISGGSDALAAIGLISFAGVAQFLPVLLGGIFWRGGSRSGAVVGLIVGFALWTYTLFLPSFGPDVVLSQSVFEQGPWGLAWLRPQALFGIAGLDPLVHATVWSLSLNTAAFFAVSLFTFPDPLERLQGAQFVNVFDHSTTPQSWTGTAAQSEDLLIMVQRIIGASEARGFFAAEAARQGLVGGLPQPSPDFLERLERELAASVGAATAHAMVGQIVGGAAVSVEDLMAVADESAQMLEYSSTLEAQSRELARTAGQLRTANDKLTQLSLQKDAFLSQISHELRTPMTSIRAFSEILTEPESLTAKEQAHFAGVIHQEANRLTRLLDDLLDLSVLEQGQVKLNTQEGSLAALLDSAQAASLADVKEPLDVRRSLVAERIVLRTDLDRLQQVFINLITNAQKYCESPAPVLFIEVKTTASGLVLDFADNGKGVPIENQALIFEKFSRIQVETASGAGLGLAICREVMHRLGGHIAYIPKAKGTVFRVVLPPEVLCTPVSSV